MNPVALLGLGWLAVKVFEEIDRAAWGDASRLNAIREAEQRRASAESLLLALDAGERVLHEYTTREFQVEKFVRRLERRWFRRRPEELAQARSLLDMLVAKVAAQRALLAQIQAKLDRVAVETACPNCEWSFYSTEAGEQTCPNCSQEFAIDSSGYVEGQTVGCPHCWQDFYVQDTGWTTCPNCDDDFTVDSYWEAEGETVTCPSCFVEVYTEDDIESAKCASCGSDLVEDY